MFEEGLIIPIPPTPVTVGDDSDGSDNTVTIEPIVTNTRDQTIGGSEHGLYIGIAVGIVSVIAIAVIGICICKKKS